MLADGEVPGDAGGELQRVKLGLVWEFHSPQGGEGQGQVLGQLGGDIQGFQSGQLLLQGLAAGGGINIVILRGKTAVDVPAKTAVFFQSPLICLPVQLRPLGPQAAEQLAVKQTMLGGNLGGGVLGDASGDNAGFRHGTAHPGALQLVGAQQPRHAAADNQHIHPGLPPQRREMGHRPGGFPDGFHSISSFGGSMGKNGGDISAVS